MLLSSASTPISKSCSFRSSPEPDHLGILIHTTTRSVSMSTDNKIPRTLSDGDLNRLHMSSKKEKEKKNKSFLNNHQLTSQDETTTAAMATSTSCLRNGLVLDNGCDRGCGGRGGVSGGGGGGDGYGDSGQGSESMDVYNQKMIGMYPGDALIQEGS